MCNVYICFYFIFMYFCAANGELTPPEASFKLVVVPNIRASVSSSTRFLFLHRCLYIGSKSDLTPFSVDSGFTGLLQVLRWPPSHYHLFMCCFRNVQHLWTDVCNQVSLGKSHTKPSDLTDAVPQDIYCSCAFLLSPLDLWTLGCEQLFVLALAPFTLQ